uniref:Uncharacterized protein n=1 Tax=Capitella teleta TaxID=283909 RepID=X1YZA8_CAPTE
MSRFLVETNGACVNAQNFFGDTALHHAIRTGSYDTVRLLLEHGADVNMKNMQEEDGYWAAIRAQSFDMSRFLVETNGACVNAQNFFGDTALHHAIRTGSYDTVRLLLEHGADVNMKNMQEEDGYWAAIRSPYPVMVAVLKNNTQPRIM